MARCRFSIEFSGSPEGLIQKANEGLAQVKGNFTGDTSQGSFTVPTPLGSIKGAYVIEGFTITIDVHDKPMLLSCSRIETELRKFMN
jgi:hypothetical protein